VPPSTEERTVKATHPTRGASRLTTVAIAQTSVDIVLDATGSIDGVAPGHDVSFAVAILSEDGRARYYADIDTLGRFSFPSLPTGEYEVDTLGGTRFPRSRGIIVTAGKTTTVVFGPPITSTP
jgi:hypothetical protein